MEIDEEKELIKQAREDPAVFADIYEEYHPKIFGYILKRTASVEVFQDLTAETFFKALHKLWQFRWRYVHCCLKSLVPGLSMRFNLFSG